MTRCVVALVLALVCVGLSHGQYAPEGNAHPESRLLTEGEVDNPFGEPMARPTMTPDQKHAFAESVDLSALVSAAVFHNGRVKTIGTLAEETVR